MDGSALYLHGTEACYRTGRVTVVRFLEGVAQIPSVSIVRITVPVQVIRILADTGPRTIYITAVQPLKVVHVHVILILVLDSYRGNICGIMLQAYHTALDDNVSIPAYMSVLAAAIY